MKTTLALAGLGIIGLFALLFLRSKACAKVMGVDSYGRQSYVRPGQITSFVCAGAIPPVRPNTAETDPKFAQPSQTKRWCNLIVGGGSSVAASSSDPRVKAAAAYTAGNTTDTCDVVSELGGAVQDIAKGAKDLFGGLF